MPYVALKLELGLGIYRKDKSPFALKILSRNGNLYRPETPERVLLQEAKSLMKSSTIRHFIRPRVTQHCLLNQN